MDSGQGGSGAVSVGRNACGLAAAWTVPGWRLRTFDLSAGYRIPPHEHALDGWVVVLKGSLAVETRGTSLEIEGGHAFRLPGGLAHEEHPVPHAVCLLATSARGSDLVGTSMVPWELSRLDRCTFRMACEAMETGPPVARSFATRALSLLLDDLGGRTGVESARAIAISAWMRLERDFDSPLRIADVAEELNVGPDHAGRLFRAVFGTSMSSYRRRRRLEHAVSRLRSESTSIAQIAMATGFADQSHLTRQLRREFGITPGQIRAEKRGSPAELGRPFPPVYHTLYNQSDAIG